jgi:hypothetical protein
LNSALHGGEWERAPDTPCVGGWVGPRAVLDAVVKRKIPGPRRQSNPRTTIVQPVAQRLKIKMNDNFISAIKYQHDSKNDTDIRKFSGSFKSSQSKTIMFKKILTYIIYLRMSL